QRPAAEDKTKVEAGEQVYANNCQVCHGDRLVSSGQFPNLRRLKADDQTRFAETVRNGRNQMPPWRGVRTEDEIDQLWACLQSLRRRGRAAPCLPASRSRRVDPSCRRSASDNARNSRE